MQFHIMRGSKLEKLRREAAKQMDAVQQAIILLRGTQRRYKRKRQPKVHKYKMSAAARRRISQVQKLRWAKWHAKKKVVGIRRIA